MLVHTGRESSLIILKNIYWPYKSAIKFKQVVRGYTFITKVLL